MKRSRWILLALAVSASSVHLAHAQSAEDIATAKAAIRDARELRAKGDLKAALPKFQAAYALVPTPLTGLDYGSTLAQLGQLVEAREVLVAVTKMPGEGTEDEVHAKARADAAALADQLLARIPSLTIVLASVPPGQTPRVSVDGRDVPAAALSVPRRLNPGHHTVRASVEGGGSASTEIDLTERDSKQVTLDLAAAPAPPAASPGVRAVAPAPSAPETRSGGLGGRKVLALVVGGAGVVLAGVGAYLNVSGKSSYEDATSHCNNGLCPPSDADTASSAATQGTIGMLMVATGVLAVGGGVVLWLTAPHAANATSGRAPSPSAGVALAPNGVVLRGAF